MAALAFGCMGKISYETFVAARRALKRRLRRHKHRKEHRGRLEPYRCHCCRCWHIGSSSL